MASRRTRLPDAWRPLAAWITIGLLLHLAWEIAQLPLYTIWRDAGQGLIAFAIFHYLLGDILISAAMFVVSAGVLRDLRWPITKASLGAAIAIPLGVIYTGWSEWYNVYATVVWFFLAARSAVSRNESPAKARLGKCSG